MSVISFRAPDASVPLDTCGVERLTIRSAFVADVSLVAFMLAMLVAMALVPGRETIPYHLLFLALTLVYGFRVWNLATTLLVTGGVTLLTGWVMFAHYASHDIDGQELAEVPLMPLLFVAMVWHARRRVVMQRQLEIMADERRTSLEREREFFRDASHAIRTPVTIARGHLELIQAKLTEPLTREDADVVLRQLDRMAALSTRLLALARIDSGEAVKPLPLDLSAFVAEVGCNWSTSVDRDWVIECAPCGLVSADPEWLELAIDALMENAVRFTSESDRIVLRCACDGGECAISVSDTGPGIAPGDLPFVFDRFWHRRPPGGLPGSGLGLAMVKAVAVAHGGLVTVTNGQLGGAEFRLALPGAPVAGN